MYAVKATFLYILENLLLINVEMFIDIWTEEWTLFQHFKYKHHAIMSKKSFWKAEEE